MNVFFYEWNVEDPVSAFELRSCKHAEKQKSIYDNPYLATVIWGGPAAQNTWPDTFSGGGTVDNQAPKIPTNLAVSATTSSSVSLTWTSSTDNIAVNGYEIYIMVFIIQP